jgi:hypothetical protein
MSLSSVFVVGCSLQLRGFTPARPHAVRVRRLALTALAILALVAGLTLSTRLTQPPPAPGDRPAAHTTPQEQP